MITKERRQEIVRDFALKHGGVYDPALFFDEVYEKGEDHPAHGWFEWDGDKAAREYNIWQARVFANGLRVKFTVEEVGRSGKMTVREIEMPMLLSPMDNRQSGGGYYMVDQNNPEHMREHCRQAALSLNTWLERYRSALAFAGVSPAGIEKLAHSIEVAGSGEERKQAA